MRAPIEFISKALSFLLWPRAKALSHLAVPVPSIYPPNSLHISVSQARCRISSLPMFELMCPQTRTNCARTVLNSHKVVTKSRHFVTARRVRVLKAVHLCD